MVYDVQSGEQAVPYTLEEAPTTKTSETVEFHDQASNWIFNHDAECDPSFATTKNADDSLAAFLSRPVLIHTSDWATTNASYSDFFNPWLAYFGNTTITRKINNYNNLRCKLHLKFLINGNAFLYGRAVAAYTPLQNESDFPLPVLVHQQTVTRMTSRPHVFLDPNASQGGEMILPYFHWNSNTSLPRAKIGELGIIDVKAINRLKHANGATDAVRITVFAWAEDVVVSTPTNILYGTQSGGDGDEYQGVISKAASTAATIAGALTRIPYMAPYARASQMMLNGVGSMAALFGYSRPVQTEMSLFKAHYFGNTANCNVHDSSQKLTTDVKQECTIDPRTVGLGPTDEMTIQSIVTRSAYLGTAPWTVAVGTGVKLMTIGVTPYVWSENTVAGNLQYYFPPCAHAAMAFRNWRGTMRYRFQIVASNFHKGRLQIQYDPFNSTLNDFASAFNRVIDISEQRDFTVEVGWGIPENYGEAINPGLEGLPYRFSNSNLPYPTANPWQYNGQISVFVLNDLTVPNSAVDNDIEINVYISCGDDFEFQNPSETIIDNFVYRTPPAQGFAEILDEQSGASVVADDVAGTQQLGKPSIMTPVTSMANTDMGGSALADVCFGERIVSFRSLIKRYSLHEVIGFSGLENVSTGRVYTWIRRKAAFPCQRGWSTINNIYASASQGGYWYTNNHLMNWLAPAYAGRRGGIRHKFVPLNLTQGTSGFSLNENAWHQCIRESNNTLNEQMIIQDLGVVSTLSRNTLANLTRTLLSGYAGFSGQPVRTNPALEVEIPYASPLRFVPAQGDSTQTGLDNMLRYSITFLKPSAGAVVVLDYVAAADDFSFFFYVGPPPAYYVPTNPTPG
jgi:hypothetical protein